jgi:predicted RNA-binding Zn ribbon-like protein
MEPLFLSGHVALDFLNTLPTPRGEAVELIGDGRSFAAWLERAKLLGGATAAKIERRFGAAALDSSSAEARKLREWARGWISVWRDAPGADYGAEIRHLNRVLERARRYGELVPTGDGLKLEGRDRLETTDELIALLAAQIASLVATERSLLVKRCSGAGCSLWFVDRTKAHARRFCSAAVCGNRAKVAAFRERRRDIAR